MIGRVARPRLVNVGIAPAAPQAMGSGVRGSALALVTDGVLHLIGKLQPLLIGLNPADNSAFVLVVEGIVHPISRHYTRSDRVQCSLTGAMLPIGLSPGRGVTRADELPSVVCGNGCGFPKISHVMSLLTFQIVNDSRCNSNVCGSSRKPTRRNPGSPVAALHASPATASGPDMCPGLVPAPRAKARARRSGFP